MSALDPAARARLAANLAAVRARIAAACAAAGRDPAAVALVAVSKYTGPEVARALLALGQRDLGENRTDHLVALDEALAGGEGGAPRPRWHMIGHLQRNKARHVAARLAALHSLDSLDLARRLDALRPADAPPLDVYAEVRLAAAEGRSGVAEGDLPALLGGLRALGRLRPAGLMGLPPLGEDPRPHFERLAALRAALVRAGDLPPDAGLSMGMTDDLEAAVACGSTVVRVGRALVDGV